MVASSIEEFFRNFDSKVYQVTAGGRGAPSRARVEAFEEELGCPLPAEYRDFVLSPLGGLSIEVRPEFGPQVLGLNIFGLAVPIPEALDLREEIVRLPPEDGDLIPFMARVGAEQRFCFDLDDNIVEWSPGGQRRTMDLRFSELVLQELESLEIRRLKSSGSLRH